MNLSGISPSGGFRASIVLLSLWISQAHGSLYVSHWLLEVGALDFEHSLYSTHSITQVENPFQTSDTATLPTGSFSTASYDFAWLLDDAHFDITTSHHLAQLDGETITSGRIFLTPSVDSLVTLSGNWQYTWPSTAVGTALIGISVLDTTDPDNQVLIAGRSTSGGNFPFGQPFGSLSIADNGIIQADHVYELSYLAQVYHYDPTPPGTFGEASGDFHFTITPIPEPVAALLLVLPFLAMRSRRLR